MERVAVVGAGMAGLVTAKEVLEEGSEVVLFEEEAKIGGVFSTGLGYDRMHLTVSNYFMAFSSLPPPEDQGRYFWSRAEYVQYLERFTDKFDLKKHTRTSTKVTGIFRNPDGTFRVASMGPLGPREENFTAVAICRGAFRRVAPRMIPLEGNYTGEIVHTADWSGPEQFRGKRVVCVGMGETSADITKWISDVAQECWLSMRSYPLLIERYPYGGADTNDAFSTRVLHWGDHIRTVTALKERLLHYSPEMPARNRLVLEWLSKSKGGRFLQKNDVFIDNVLSGAIKPTIGGIERCEGKRIYFKDGQSTEADIVMLCTGYEEGSIPSDWVEGLEIPDVRHLYKHMFHPDTGRRLAFIGWARPVQGGIPAAAEMQARLFARACSGKWDLPQGTELHDKIAADVARETALTNGIPYMRTLVRYTDYMDDVANLVGCNPKLEDFLDDPDLLYRLACGSNIAPCYRLVGPHADPEGARKVIMRVPVAMEKSVPHRDIFDQLIPHNLVGRVPAEKLDQIVSVLKSRFTNAWEGRPTTYVQATPPSFS
ncbi:NAD(P)-binding protein [Pendulispora rubella]|uniref:NAD(P)-binding protein n=1 Tax=Pendulispora rubella TaxID=2741070 RepID=A0ABZ2KX46_9BACT